MRRITHGPQSYYNDSISYGHSLHSQCSYKYSQNVISEGFITLKITAFVRNSMRLLCDQLKTYVHGKGRRYIVRADCTCTLYVYIVRVDVNGQRAQLYIIQREINTDIGFQVLNCKITLKSKNRSKS